MDESGVAGAGERAAERRGEAGAWERGVLEKLVLETLDEKRRARRWSIFFRLVQKYEANLISTLTLMCPLMGIGLGVLVTGDRFDMRMMIGTAVVLTGVAVILTAPRSAPR